MYRNHYDTDCTTWSPQGRIYQSEYAMEGVKQGTCGLGVRSNTHVVLCGIKRTMSKLAGFNQKLLKVDDHLGLVFSGITADAKYLANYMRRECLRHQFIFNSPHPTEQLVAKVGAKSQVNTQRYSKRPYGCGLLVGGVDSTGPRLFETCPTGNFYEYFAMAFGSRSQASKTYLEKNFEAFPEMPLEDLIFHAVKALHCSVAQDQELTIDNMCIGVVSADSPWRELPGTDIQHYIDRVSTAAAPASDSALTDDALPPVASAVTAE